MELVQSSVENMYDIKNVLSRRYIKIMSRRYDSLEVCAHRTKEQVGNECTAEAVL